VHKAVFLDRDGTINAMVDTPSPGLVDTPATPEEFHLLPGVGEAVRTINEAGWLTVVVSNQPGIAKGRFTPSELEAVTRKMHDELARFGARLDAVLYCLHHPQAVREEFRVVCACRKPKPGLLLQGARALDIELAHSYLVGDRISDIEAGAAVGCRTVLVGTPERGTGGTGTKGGVVPDHSVSTLREAVNVILRGRQTHGHLS